MRVKHIPQRTCIGCYQTQAKRELLRIVRTPEGHVLADPTGKKNGRGAYVHKTRECWEAVLNTRGRLEHALKLETPLAPEERAALVELGKTFPARESSEKGMAGQEPELRHTPESVAKKKK